MNVILPSISGFPRVFDYWNDVYAQAGTDELLSGVNYPVRLTSITLAGFS
jgi:hypothetical protein